MIENPSPMMQLSDRLQAMADRVPLGDRMADIGTDHGHLPVYLFEREHSPFVVMTDISAPSLEKAKRAAGAYQFGGGMSFRLGSGLEVLEPGEVDTVVIAGMGGKLIRDILSADPEKTRSYSRFVLQPRIAAGALRKWLLEAGFRIFSEDIVEEGHFFPEVITAGKKENRVLDSRDLAEMHRGILAGLSEDHIFFRVPPWIARAGGPVEKYLLRKLDQERRVREGLQAAREQDGMRINAIQENILYLEKLLKQVRAGQQPG